jgi:voltage-dependent calcium channel N type alpha-1B
MEMAFFYIIYFIVFPFFFVNIFVALIIITFQEQGEKELAENEINKNQKSCMDFAINAKPMAIYIPKNKEGFKYKVWSLATSNGFEFFILFFITINTLILMMKVSHLTHVCFDPIFSCILQSRFCLLFQSGIINRSTSLGCSSI